MIPILCVVLIVLGFHQHQILGRHLLIITQLARVGILIFTKRNECFILNPRYVLNAYLHEKKLIILIIYLYSIQLAVLTGTIK